MYTTYLVNQVQGSLQGAGSGFTLWNASNDYYMVTVPLAPIIQGSAGSDVVGSDRHVARSDRNGSLGDAPR
jgi:hypothetical protein